MPRLALHRDQRPPLTDAWVWWDYLLGGVVSATAESMVERSGTR